jgi:hypothetical protein
MASVPELIDAAHAAFRALPDLSDVEVLDGPAVTDTACLDWVLVGYDGEEGSKPFDQGADAASAEHDWSGMSTQQQERISLPITILCGRGDTDVRAARNRVYEIVGHLRAYLRLNPSVGLASTRCSFTSSRLYQDQTRDGIQARLSLTLTCDTFGL